MKLTDLQVITTDWNSHQKQLSEIRKTVFVEEQSVPVEMELDDYDLSAIHFLAVTDDKKTAIGTARLLKDGHLGRMAVLKPYRQQSVGRAMLLAAINFAQSHSYPALFLNAQISAAGFYEKAGFAKEGGEFMDAGILHIRMSKSLTADSL